MRLSVISRKRSLNGLGKNNESIKSARSGVDSTVPQTVEHHCWRDGRNHSCFPQKKTALVPRATAALAPQKQDKTTQQQPNLGKPKRAVGIHIHSSPASCAQLEKGMQPPSLSNKQIQARRTKGAPNKIKRLGDAHPHSSPAPYAAAGRTSAARWCPALRSLPGRCRRTPSGRSW